MISVLRLFLGLWFATSALAKLSDWRGFRQGALDYALGPPAGARAVGWLLPWVELGMAPLLVAGLWVRPVAMGLIALLAVFSAAIAINLRRGRRNLCHCHGTRRPQPIGVGPLVRNAWLVACALSLVVLAGYAVPATDSPGPGWLSGKTPWTEAIPQGLLVIWLWLIGSLSEVAATVLSRRPPTER